MNTDAPWPDLYEAEQRVLKIQAKLHQWATDSPGRRFDDPFNLVADPAFLVVAWDRVRGNRGARTAGVDGVKPRSIVFGRAAFLSRLREDLKAGQFRPLPVREKLIPKKGGKLRGLGIPTARDRTLPGTLKLVLEPIFRRTSGRAATVSVPATGLRTPSPRSIISRAVHTNGSWKAILKLASMKSRTLASWAGYGGESGTNESWRS